MSDTLVPLSKVATLIVRLLIDTVKQAELLTADDAPTVKAKAEKNENKDVKIKDEKLDPTNNVTAAKEMSEDLAPVVDDYTAEGTQTKAKDESSCVLTDRGSVHASNTDKLAEFICKVLDKRAANAKTL